MQCTQDKLCLKMCELELICILHFQKNKEFNARTIMTPTSQKVLVNNEKVSNGDLVKHLPLGEISKNAISR